jgi:hypothetical protein
MSFRAAGVPTVRAPSSPSPMKAISLLIVTAALFHVPLAEAQTGSLPPALRDAIKLREDMAAAITTGHQKADAALLQLRVQPALSGDSDLDLASAAADVGQRLWCAGKAAEAGVFFKAAEVSLSRKIDRTPDASAQEKAQHLAARAFLRARHLNEAVLAKADLDAAQTLVPNDPYLTSLRSSLSSDKAEQFRDTPKG